jgi:hypothetical protein
VTQVIRGPETTNLPSKNLAGTWIKISTKEHHGVKADFTIKRGQKISYYVKLIKWQSCSSPAFGVSEKIIAADSSICSEYPIGASYKGPSKYKTTGTYSNKEGTTYLVDVDRKYSNKITIKSINDSSCDLVGNLETSV